jgi:DNA polymerase-3 subunit epsilon
MNWLTRMLFNRTDLTSLNAGLRDALAHWHSLAQPALDKPHFETRYVVLNTTSSGFNTERDALLEVAGIAIESGLLVPASSYAAELTPDAATTLMNLLTFCERGPAVLFNAALNRSMLERALEKHLGVALQLPTIDLYWLLPALFPERSNRPVKLSYWVDLFGVETFKRQHALGDAYAIGQLMLIANSRAKQRGLATAQSLIDLEQTHRQLVRP